ncbi:hypothetical protein I2F17_09005 [Acinetobacter sp. B10A]|uniref:hypothetical protein n=1 Tax=Acinetobacter baretiae TaxID=2605383 RepID=UPI001B3C80CB|nr:hypothetical protein [Acinetobacter baretiae]MBF7685953.1 hypothetical protein [Acinetobacter baretiae]
MMTLTQAHIAMIRRVSQFTGIDQNRILYPQSKQPFVVPTNGLWCSVDIFVGQSLISGIADGPQTRRLSIIQITCYARPNTGLLELNNLADSWLNHLEYYQTGQLECLNGEIAQNENADFVIRYIRVPYRVN